MMMSLSNLNWARSVAACPEVVTASPTVSLTVVSSYSAICLYCVNSSLRALISAVTLAISSIMASDMRFIYTSPSSAPSSQHYSILVASLRANRQAAVRATTVFLL